MSRVVRCYCGSPTQAGSSFCGEYPLCVRKEDGRIDHVLISRNDNASFRQPIVAASPRRKRKKYDLKTLRAKIAALPPAPPVSDVHDDARQAMQVIISGVDNVKQLTGMRLGANDDLERISRAVFRLDETLRRMDAAIVSAQVAGLREAAKMISDKSDLLRGTRGGVNKACFEMDLTMLDLTKRADALAFPIRSPVTWSVNSFPGKPGDRHEVAREFIAAVSTPSVPPDAKQRVEALQRLGKTIEPLYAIHARQLFEGTLGRPRLLPWRVVGLSDSRAVALQLAAGLRELGHNERTRVRKVAPGADPWELA